MVETGFGLAVVALKKSGKMKSLGASDVSRTSRRKEALARSRRGRIVGKDIGGDPLTILPRMRLLRFCALAAVVEAATGCGSRTGLLVPDEPRSEPPEAGMDAGDATVPKDAGMDAPADVAPDRFVDARLDATEEDVTVDAVADVIVDVLPPVDVRHTMPVDCQEAGAAATLIYLITQESDLWSFFPPTLAFNRIGRINCPAKTVGATPFSMAVDHTGIAYVVYNDGELFRVRTANAACQATPFRANQEGFPSTFGMGYSQNPTGVGETLYIASDEDAGTLSRLAYIDTNAFALHAIGSFPPKVVSAELTGTGAGDLFAFYALTANNGGPAPPPSAIAQVDKANGNIIGQNLLPTLGQGCAWAFAFWGGDFYTFTSPGVAGACPSTPSPSVVSRINATDGTVVSPYTNLGEQIVGAGVSTCAPQE